MHLFSKDESSSLPTGRMEFLRMLLHHIDPSLVIREKMSIIFDILHQIRIDKSQ